MSEGDERSRLVLAIADRLRSLALVSDRVTQEFAASVDMHPTDLRALSLIYEHEKNGHPLTAKALAGELDLSQAAITYSAQRLEAAGHITRERDPHDGRRVVLRFAPHGFDVAGAYFAPLGVAHAHSLADYSEAELALCERMLADIVRGLTPTDCLQDAAPPHPAAREGELVPPTGPGERRVRQFP